MENDEEMVKIGKEEYKHLLEDSDTLSALEEAGVDNWEGYDDAMDILRDIRNNKNDSK
jgi:hypothetical protein